MTDEGAYHSFSVAVDAVVSARGIGRYWNPTVALAKGSTRVTARSIPSTVGGRSNWTSPDPWWWLLVLRVSAGIYFSESGVPMLVVALRGKRLVTSSCGVKGATSPPPCIVPPPRVRSLPAPARPRGEVSSPQNCVKRNERNSVSDQTRWRETKQ